MRIPGDNCGGSGREVDGDTAGRYTRAVETIRGSDAIPKSTRAGVAGSREALERYSNGVNTTPARVYFHAG